MNGKQNGNNGVVKLDTLPKPLTVAPFSHIFIFDIRSQRSVKPWNMYWKGNGLVRFYGEMEIIFFTVM